MEPVSSDGFVETVEAVFRREEPSVGPFEGSQQYTNSQNHAAGIRAPHAIAALKEANSVARWNLGGGLYVTLALAAPNDARPYATLIEGVETPSKRGVWLAEAWRLYGDDWPPEPTAALGAFLGKFGLVIKTGDVRTKFLARVPTDAPLEFNTERSWTLRQFDDVKNGSRLWVCCIDVDAYRNHVAKHRR